MKINLESSTVRLSLYRLVCVVYCFINMNQDIETKQEKNANSEENLIFLVD
jgi:hypothetical protein